MIPKIEIFDARSIDRFTASSASMANPAGRYLASLAARGARHYVDNVDVEVKALAVDGQVPFSDTIPGCRGSSASTGCCSPS